MFQLTIFLAEAIGKRKNRRHNMFRYNRLLGRMSEMGVTQKRAAQAIGISENSFTNKLKCRSYFNSKEIYELCVLLKIAKEDIGTFFFNTP